MYVSKTMVTLYIKGVAGCIFNNNIPPITKTTTLERDVCFTIMNSR